MLPPPPQKNKPRLIFGITYNTIMGLHQIVMDTNVLVSALMSKQGASFRLLNLVGKKNFQINLSVPLVIEYEDVLKRNKKQINLSSKEINDILDYLCSQAKCWEVFFLWRPFLKDPKDDHLLELAVRANCHFIITFNKRDFEGTESFNIKTLTPQEFFKKIGEIK